MIGLYFRTIPDANLLDTVCISMRACIFPAGSHKGVVFTSLSVSIFNSFFFPFFFFKIRGAKRQGIIVHRTARTPEMQPFSRRERPAECLHGRKYKANCCNSRINANSRVLTLLELGFSLITLFRCSVGIARRERCVNMQDATSGYAAAEKSQPYTVVKIKFSEYCRNTRDFVV